jgi:hypothetical protein
MSLFTPRSVINLNILTRLIFFDNFFSLQRNVHRTRATLRLRALQSTSSSHMLSDTAVTAESCDASGKRKKDKIEKISIAPIAPVPTSSTRGSTSSNPLFPSVNVSNGKKKDSLQDMKSSLFPRRDSKNEKMDIFPSPPSSLSLPAATFKSHKRNLILTGINISAAYNTQSEETVLSPKLNDRQNKKHFSPSEVVIPEDSQECSQECSSPDVRGALDIREIRLSVRNTESIKKTPSTTRKTKLVILEEENEDDSETENEIVRMRKEQFEALIMKSEKTPCYNTTDVEEAMLRLQREFNAKGYVRGNQREDEADGQDMIKEKDKSHLSKRKSVSTFESSKLISKSLFSSLCGTSKAKPSKSEDFTLRQTENPRTAGLMWERPTALAPSAPVLPPLSSPSARVPSISPSPALTPRTSREHSSRQVSKRTNSTTNSSHCATPVVFTDAIFDIAAYQTFNDDLESSLKNTYDFVFANTEAIESRSSSMMSPARSGQRLSITPLKTPTSPIASPIITPAGSMRLSA